MLIPWILFIFVLIAILFMDLFLFHRKPHAICMKEAIWGSIFWIALAMSFNVYIYFNRGAEDALNFFTGYLIEKSLSVDNLFVFILIFKYFQTPKSAMHKVLFWGVLSAILLRALFIWLGIVLISKFHVMIYIFGGFLVFSGIKLWEEKGNTIDPEKNIILRLFRRYFRVTNEYEDDKFFVFKRSYLYATPLFVVLLVIETTDVIFAVDSIPAILAITSDPFIVFTSNIFAILGLRSLYFVLSHIMSLFHYLHYGLSIILVFTGIKMLSSDLYKISNVVALGVVFAVLAISVGLSLKYPKKLSLK